MQDYTKKKPFFWKRNVEALNRRSGTERLLYVIVFVIFALQAFTMFFVFWWLLNNSLKDPFEYGKLQNSMQFPKELLFENYIKAFQNSGVPVRFNTILLQSGINTKERMHKIIKNYQELFEKNAVKITKNNR